MFHLCARPSPAASGPMSRATPSSWKRDRLPLTRREEPLRNTGRTALCDPDVRTRPCILQGEVDVSTFAVTLVVVWLLGSISSLTLGGFLHIFPIVAISLMLPRLIYGRKAIEI